MRPVAAEVLSIQRMICTGCGAEANASCNCGVSYIPKAVRAREAVAASPEKSNRALADELGVDEKTVRKARANQSAPETVTGKDGKSYPAKRDAEPEEDEDYEIDIPRKESFINDARTAGNLGHYEGPLDDEMQKAAGAAADAWASYAGNKTKWKTKDSGYMEILRENCELQDRINGLLHSLSAKEMAVGRTWPNNMTPKQVKRREKILGTIAWWQRDLERLYGEITGAPSWRVEIFFENGERLGNGLRFGTRDEAELYREATYKKQIEEPKRKGHCEIIPCSDKLNVEVHGDSIRFEHGGCVLFNWHPVDPEPAALPSPAEDLQIPEYLKRS
jgi:hypothetical protein